MALWETVIKSQTVLRQEYVGVWILEKEDVHDHNSLMNFAFKNQKSSKSEQLKTKSVL